MIKEKYKQLCLSLQFGDIGAISIHRYWWHLNIVLTEGIA